ncbi:hypothetical protein SmJEL517_g00769 [Synchytrium microbalum]|uniref:Uncharacterized protein n=1 Tax=Synchytrium microbalum TaxID=1806994 RepID=A0A507CDQ0_9FUNG|nr:uncharacterized protein SmJEL517_g00769 [Synchytrium microbalum]TPX37468.1 hypothetical protein SmJEL517_g00769 [Synchytrium microbalum]
MTTSQTAVSSSFLRNKLPPFQRFITPLYFEFFSDDRPVNITDSKPAPSNVVVEVHQSLENVNCVWDACTIFCGYLIANSESVFALCQPPGDVFRVLEIGSGSGLLGIVALLALKPVCHRHNKQLQVCMTDLEEELDVIKQTVAANFSELESKPLVEALEWGSTEQYESLILKLEGDELDVVLATDVVYEIQHFDLLFRTLKLLLRPNTLFIMAMERRWSDITRFFWDDAKSYGFNYEMLPKSNVGDGPWWEMPHIDIYFIRKVIVETNDDVE